MKVRFQQPDQGVIAAGLPQQRRVEQGGEILIAPLEGAQVIALQPAGGGFARQGTVQPGQQHGDIFGTAEAGIAAFAVQHHVGDLGRRLRQQVVGHGHRIADGVVQSPDNLPQLFQKTGGADFQPVMVGVIAIHHQLHELIFPGVFRAEMRRKGRDAGSGQLLAGDRQHRAGIDAAGEEDGWQPVRRDGQAFGDGLF
ncbi:MAG: hypothetical protein U5O69_00645 [Candidatus Competibacteraceae bacterium]|nr:hypothetical protein [Candidatus Competibacteraceae bacterium]